MLTHSVSMAPGSSEEAGTCRGAIGNEGRTRSRHAVSSVQWGHGPHFRPVAVARADHTGAVRQRLRRRPGRAAGAVGRAHGARPAVLVSARLPGSDRPAPDRNAGRGPAGERAGDGRGGRPGRPGHGALGIRHPAARGERRICAAVWFNQPFLRDKYRRGQTLLVSGRAKRRNMRWEMVHPQVRVVDTEGEPPSGQLLPVYPLTEGLAQRHVRNLVRRALDTCTAALEEVFPEAYLTAHDLLPLQVALPQLHFPSSRAELGTARRRFIYQELLILQLALAVKRRQVHDSLQADPLELTAKIDARIRRLLPFELTAGQNQAIAEIAADLNRPHPMNRLLQGDVGSGKTIVAVYAMLLAVAHKAQVVLMAPTEVLARQHVETLSRLLAGSHTRMGLLTGGQSAKVRQRAADGNRLGRSADRGWHAGGRFGRGALRAAGADRDRRAAQVWRAAAGGAAQCVGPPAHADHDRHADPAHGGHDPVRRSGRDDASRRSAGPAKRAHLFSAGRGPAALVGVLSQEAGRGTAGLRDRAAGRGLGRGASHQLERGLRGTDQRRARGVSTGAGARPHDADGKRGRHGRLPPRADAGAGGHVGGRGGRRRAQCHIDDDRRRRAIWAGPVAPTARADQPRIVPGLLHGVCQRDDGRRGRAAEGVRRVERRVPPGGARFRAARTGRTAGHAAARPAATAHCRPGARRGYRARGARATPRRWWPPTRDWRWRSMRCCGEWHWCATASRSSWATWADGIIAVKVDTVCAIARMAVGGPCDFRERRVPALGTVCRMEF